MTGENEKPPTSPPAWGAWRDHTLMPFPRANRVFAALASLREAGETPSIERPTRTRRVASYIGPFEYKKRSRRPR